MPESERESLPGPEPEQPSASEAEAARACTGGCTSSKRSQNGSGTAGLRANVNVTIGLDTLLGLNEDTAELAGHGPITAPLARALAFAEGSTWRRLVTDPDSGYLLDYGRTTYRPPAALADHVRARDVTCRMPNCNRPATTSDLDHLIPYPTGTTSEPNLCAACRRDHQLKTHGRWQHHLSNDPAHPPGTTVLISPTGHAYLSHPYSYTSPDPPADPHLDFRDRLDDFGRLKSPPQKWDPMGSSGGTRTKAGDADDPGPPPF
jgi:hypothetical protein